MFFLLTLAGVLLSIAFYTLLERKLLGYCQIRKGPNKVSVRGILQPVVDAVKLFNKRLIFSTRINWGIMVLRGVLGLFLRIILWALYEPIRVYFFCGVFYFLFFSRIMVYPVLVTGWSRNSKFSLLGGYRGIAQTISYEIRIIFLLIRPLIIKKSLEITREKKLIFFCCLFLLVFLMWLISCLAETNRAPFDFREGESELVSGFNTEYEGLLFMLLFIAEYISILFISYLTAYLFLGNFLYIRGAFYLLVTLISFLFLLIRARYPRIRYDLLIYLTWKIMLPGSLLFLIGVFFMK